MSLLINLLIVLVIAYSVYQGTRRGMALLALELVSLIFAAWTALMIYQHVGAIIKSSMHTTTALSNVVAFVVVWALAELVCALAIRFLFLPRPIAQVRLTRLSRLGGGILGGIRATVLIALGLAIFAGLPLSAAQKLPVTDAWLARQLIYSTGGFQAQLSGGLGRDLGDSFSFVTVPAEPHDEKSISLGYTTTKVTVNARDEAAMLELVNQERTSRGLPALTLNPKARTVARAYSTDMFARGYFSHVNPEGLTPFDRMRSGGVDFGAAGENLALAPNLKQAHTGLMNSPGHRANILSTDYRAVGIGIVDGGPYGIMVTQNFTD